MAGLIQQVKERAEWHVKKTLMGVIGAIFVLVGGGFGVAAAWVALEVEMGAISASLIIGAVFFGLGLLILSLSSVATRPRPRPVQEAEPRTAAPPRGMYRPSGEHPPVMEAFLLGLSIYLETKNRRR